MRDGECMRGKNVCIRKSARMRITVCFFVCAREKGETCPYFDLQGLLELLDDSVSVLQFDSQTLCVSDLCPEGHCTSLYRGSLCRGGGDRKGMNCECQLNEGKMCYRRSVLSFEKARKFEEIQSPAIPHA